MATPVVSDKAVMNLEELTAVSIIVAAPMGGFVGVWEPHHPAICATIVSTFAGLLFGLGWVFISSKVFYSLSRWNEAPELIQFLLWMAWPNVAIMVAIFIPAFLTDFVFFHI